MAPGKSHGLISFLIHTLVPFLGGVPSCCKGQRGGRTGVQGACISGPWAFHFQSQGNEQLQGHKAPGEKGAGVGGTGGAVSGFGDTRGGLLPRRSLLRHVCQWGHEVPAQVRSGGS